MENMENPKIRPVLELRVALTASDFEIIKIFYIEGLGLDPAQFWNNEQGQAFILEMGKATLEIFDEEQAKTVDRIEVGSRCSGPIRFALQVSDLEKAKQRLLDHGYELLNDEVLTPWNDRNIRIQDPEGMQITLFQRLGE